MPKSISVEKQSIGIKGGKREGAGRKAGVPNKKTAEVQAAVAASGITPLEFMLQIMRNPANEPADRLDAAKSAAPYVHAKLANVTVVGDPDNPLQSVSRIELVAPA